MGLCRTSQLALGRHGALCKGTGFGRSDLKLNSLQTFDYLFITFEEPPSGPPGQVVRLYLEGRDILQGIDPALRAKYASVPRHQEHRLILLASREVVQQLSVSFLYPCTHLFVL